MNNENITVRKARKRYDIAVLSRAARAITSYVKFRLDRDQPTHVKSNKKFLLLLKSILYAGSMAAIVEARLAMEQDKELFPEWTDDPDELHKWSEYLVEVRAIDPNEEFTYYICRWDGENFLDALDQPIGRLWQRALLTSQLAST